jgi:hypothetical protein
VIFPNTLWIWFTQNAVLLDSYQKVDPIGIPFWNTVLTGTFNMTFESLGWQSLHSDASASNPRTCSQGTFRSIPRLS